MPPALDRLRSPAAAGVSALVALALGLRLVGFWDPLAGDEVSTLYDVQGRSLGGVLDLLIEGPRESNEYTPPLYFVLAWACSKAGSAMEWIRVPSLLASLALVGVLFALGRRAFSPRVGLVAAAVGAVAPFLVFYGTEARAYALLALLCAASTLVLLRAAESGGARWWAAYAALAAGVAYTHYTGAAVLVAQGAWALAACRGQRWAVAAAHAGALALYAPWLAFVRREETVDIYALFGPRGLAGHLRVFAQALPGHPFATPGELPGAPLVVLLGLTVVACLALSVGAIRRAGRPPLASPAVLLVVVALASPAGLAALSLVEGESVFLPRSLTASLPAAIILLAALVSAPPRIPRTAATAALFVVVGAGAALTLTPDQRRPEFDRLARAIDAEARPGETVVHAALSDPRVASSRMVSIHFRRPHPERFFGVDDGPVWRRAAARGERVFVVLLMEGGVPELVRVPRGFREVARHHARGFAAYDLIVYEAVAG